MQGGQLFGTYPTLQLGGPDDAGSIGQWIPTTATVHYCASMAKWFGLSSTTLNSLFPLLGNFSRRTPKFLG